MNRSLENTGYEMNRITALSEYNLEYDQLQETLKDLALLAAKVTGTNESRVNLLDAYNQWTVAQHGIHQPHMDCAQSVCQYTIREEKEFEVKNFSADNRFNQNDYLVSTGLNYYYGVPLKTTQGDPLGALCVMDSSTKALSTDQKEMLQLISKEIISKMDSIKQNQLLKNKVRQLLDAKKMVAHDIRGPVGGIIGLAELVCEQGEDNSVSEVLEFMGMIKESGRSIMELASDILSEDEKETTAAFTGEHLINLSGLKQNVLNLFAPRIRDKGIVFEVILSLETAGVLFSKDHLQQIIGNLVSNALKFTPQHGKVSLDLNLRREVDQNLLEITVCDNGIGMDKAMVELILNGSAVSTVCTNGEYGYGIGLALVKRLVDNTGGQLSLSSEKNKGTTFKVIVPLTQ